MKKSTKETRALAKLAELLKEHSGYQLDVKAAASYAHAERVSESARLEGVLHSIRRPGDYIYKVCKRCAGPFGTNYQSVAYCSDPCRIRDFEDATGISWNSRKSPEERWGGEPPVVIPPDVIATMLPYAMRILESFRSLGLTEQELQEQVKLSGQPQLPPSTEDVPEEPDPSSTSLRIQYDFPGANLFE